MLVTFSHRPLLESCYPKAALANSSAHRLYSELLSLRHRFRYSTSIVFVLHPFFTPVFRWLCKVVRIRHCSLVIPNSIPSEGAVGTSNSPWVTSGARIGSFQELVRGRSSG